MFIDRYKSFRVLFELGKELSSLKTFPLVHYLRGANIATHASIFLRLLALLSAWMWNLIRVPLFLRVLLTICRCLKQITQRNRAMALHMLAFGMYFRFVYSRTDLLRLYPLHFDVWAWNRPRNWKYHCKWAGRLSKVKEARGALSISTTVRPRTLKSTRSLNQGRNEIYFFNADKVFLHKVLITDCKSDANFDRLSRQILLIPGDFLFIAPMRNYYNF